MTNKKNVMKIRTLILAMALAFAGSAIAQKSKVTSAVMAYKDFQEEMQDGNKQEAADNLLEAKKYIDMAKDHEKTKDDPKMIFYFGEIYTSLQAVAGLESTKDVATVENISKGMESYIRYLNLEDKGRMDYTSQIKAKFFMQRDMVIQQAGKLYQDGNYGMAAQAYSGVTQMMEAVDFTDSVAYFNGALAAENAGNYKLAAEMYQKCVQIGYEPEFSYAHLATAFFETGEEDKALKTIELGLQKFPGNQNLTIAEASYYLKSEQYDKAEEALKRAVASDNENPVMHFAVATVYDNTKQYKNAQEAYKNAIALDADYFDAIYGLGAMYFNIGVEYNNKIKDIADNVLYSKEKEKADAFFNQALPWLEKAIQLKKDDQNTLAALKPLYARLGMNDQWKIVSDALKNAPMSDEDLAKLNQGGSVEGQEDILEKYPKVLEELTKQEAEEKEEGTSEEK